MGTSFRIGSVFGITIRVHVLLLLLVALIVSRSGLPGLLLVGSLILIVLLHELGHGLVAQSFGIRVVDITFLPFGGMARMKQIPEDSRIEGLIAVAGPAVNFLLAALTVPFLFLLDPGPTGDVLTAHAFAVQFMGINLVLGVFNLVPAFPMDGARVLRAFLARRGDWLGATERTVAIGRAAAVITAVGGTLLLPAPLGCVFWGALAIWIWFSGAAELAAVRRRHSVDPVADLFERMFGGRGGPFGAQPPRAAGPDAGPDAEPGGRPGAGPRAPDGAALAEPPELPTDRELSDAEIERLERYRGSLRGFRKP